MDKEVQNQIVSLMKQIQGLWCHKEILNISVAPDYISCFAIKAEASRPAMRNDYLIDYSELKK